MAMKKGISISPFSMSTSGAAKSPSVVTVPMGQSGSGNMMIGKFPGGSGTSYRGASATKNFINATKFG